MATLFRADPFFLSIFNIQYARIGCFAAEFWQNLIFVTSWAIDVNEKCMRIYKSLLNITWKSNPKFEDATNARLDMRQTAMMGLISSKFAELTNIG